MKVEIEYVLKNQKGQFFTNDYERYWSYDSSDAMTFSSPEKVAEFLNEQLKEDAWYMLGKVLERYSTYTIECVIMTGNI